MKSGIGKEDRLNWIMYQIGLCGTVSVRELSEKIQVSTVTIRKDLKALEEQGRLKRISGGATAEQLQRGRVEESSELKHLVAFEAAKMIEDGDSLVVTSGITPHLTLLYAGERTRLQIVTDSLQIAKDACVHPDYQVMILGGEIYVRDSFVYGRDAVKQADKYMADKAIITMDGIDADAGLTTLRVEGADTLKSVLKRARVKIIVGDITKIGHESFCHIEDISVADILITNWTEDPKKQQILRKIADAGIQIRYAAAKGGKLG